MGWNVNELECESAGMETGNGNQNKLFTLVVEIRIGMGWNSIDVFILFGSKNQNKLNYFKLPKCC